MSQALSAGERAAYAQRYDDFIVDILALGDAHADRCGDPALYRFGPLPISLRVVGDALRRRLTRAIEHARDRADDQPRRVEVTAIAGAELGLVSPEWQLPTYEPRHLQRTHVSADGQRLLQHNPDTHTWLAFDRERQQAVQLLNSADDLPDWEDSFPLRTLLHWMSTPHQVCLAHTAVVEKDGVAVLLTGRGGSGKSTTTVAAIMQGMRTCGDDFVMLEIEQDAVRARALYDTVKLDDRALAWFPELNDAVSNPIRDPDQKARVHLTDYLPERLLSGTPLRAIIQPVITHDPEPSLQPVSPANVLRALAPSTLFMLRGDEAQLGAKLARLVRLLPTWELRLTQSPQDSAAWLGEVMGDWQW